MGHKNTNEPKNMPLRQHTTRDTGAFSVHLCVWFSVLERDGNTDKTSANPPQSYHRNSIT